MTKVNAYMGYSIKYLGTILVGCITSILLLSFGLHTIDASHIHPGATVAHHDDYSGEYTISAYVHASDKKMFLFTLLSFFALGMVKHFFSKSTYQKQLLSQYMFTFFNTYEKATLLQRSFLFWLYTMFAQGYVNPKVYR